MAVIIETKPLPPPTTLRQKIAALEIGQTLWTDEHTERVVRVTASRAKADMECAKFRIAEDDGGVRVWRLA